MEAVLEVPMKLLLIRKGEVTAIRRRRLVSPSYEVVAAVAAEYATGKYSLQYVDEDGDIVTMSSPDEWNECLRLWDGKDKLVLSVELHGSPAKCNCCPPMHRTAESTASDLVDAFSRIVQSCQASASRSASYFSAPLATPPADGPSHDETTRYSTPTPDAANQNSSNGFWEEADDHVVTRLLSRLFGHETLESVRNGHVPKDVLNWLSVVKLDNGDVDLQVKVNELVSLLEEKIRSAKAAGDRLGAEEWVRYVSELVRSSSAEPQQAADLHSAQTDSAAIDDGEATEQATVPASSPADVSTAAERLPNRAQNRGERAASVPNDVLELQFANEVNMLQNMGFDVTSFELSLLDAVSGDVQTVVDMLLQAPRTENN